MRTVLIGRVFSEETVGSRDVQGDPVAEADIRLRGIAGSSL